MNKIFTKIIFLLFIFCWLGHWGYAQSWRVAGTPGFSAGEVHYTSLALVANGTPFVAYQDMTFVKKGTVMQFAATSPTISTGNLEASAYCAGALLNVPFTTTGTFAEGNAFTAQLSDAAGSFANPTSIGSGTLSPVSATIPADMAAGSGYRIRIISAAPSVAGSDNGLDLTVRSAPLQPGNITGAISIWPGQSNLTYSIAPVPQATTFSWTVPEGWQITSGQGTTSITVAAGSTGGQIAVTAGNGCGQSTASTLAVAVRPAVAANTIASDQAICPGAVAQVLAGSPATGSHGSTTYFWESSTTSATEGFAPAVGINNEKDYIPSAGLQLTTWFRRRAMADNCPATATYSNVIKITVVATPAAPTALAVAQCGPGAVTLTAAGADSNGSYRWYSTAAGGTAIAEASAATFITPVLSATTTYYVATVSAGGCESDRTAVTAAINPIPAVAAGDNMTVCLGAAAFSLTGFSPAAGTWSGPGITAAGVFNPAVAGAGTHAITYSYTDAGGCMASASQNITVTTCTGIGEEAGALEWSLYPNPTPDKIRVEGSVQVKSGLLFRILRTDGSVVLEKAFPQVVGEFTHVFDLKGQAKGLYLLQQITDNGMMTRQFVLQ